VTDQSKHTLGPWEILPNRSSINGGRIVNRSGAVIGRLTSEADKPISQKEADGRLIAAAPDMLAALKLWERISTGPANAEADRALKATRAAVAKAEGRQ
jgi:hypothetical protein